MRAAHLRQRAAAVLIAAHWRRHSVQRRFLQVLCLHQNSTVQLDALSLRQWCPLLPKLVVDQCALYNPSGCRGHGRPNGGVVRRCGGRRWSCRGAHGAGWSVGRWPGGTLLLRAFRRALPCRSQGQACCRRLRDDRESLPCPDLTRRGSFSPYQRKADFRIQQVKAPCPAAGRRSGACGHAGGGIGGPYAALSCCRLWPGGTCAGAASPRWVMGRRSTR